MNNHEPLSAKSKQGKIVLAGAGVVFLLVLALIATTCHGMISDDSPDSPDTPPTSVSDVSDSDLPTVTNSDVSSGDITVPLDPNYGVIPVDGTVELDDVMLLNVYHDASQVRNGTAVTNPNDSVDVFVDGEKVDSNAMPERYTFEDGTSVWRKQVYIKDGLDFATINIIPHHDAEDVRLSVLYPDGKEYTAADGIFTYPSSDMYRWHIEKPTGGIYTFTITGTNLETYYVDIIAYH